MLAKPSLLGLQGPEQFYYSNIIFYIAPHKSRFSGGGGYRALPGPLQNSKALVCLTPPHLWVRYRQVGISTGLLRQTRDLFEKHSTRPPCGGESHGGSPGTRASQPAENQSDPE